jgi:hypothetical protein
MGSSRHGGRSQCQVNGFLDDTALCVVSSPREVGEACPPLEDASPGSWARDPWRLRYFRAATSRCHDRVKHAAGHVATYRAHGNPRERQPKGSSEPSTSRLEILGGDRIPSQLYFKGDDFAVILRPSFSPSLPRLIPSFSRPLRLPPSHRHSQFETPAPERSA